MADKKIKILYTIPNFDTAGSGKVVYDLVKNIDRDRFEPEICCFHGRGKFFKEIGSLDVKVHFFPFAINYRPFYTFPIRLIKTILFFKREKFDIIHSWHWSSDFSEPLAAKLAGIPWIYTKKSMGWGNKAWKWRSYLSTKIVTINSDMRNLFAKGLKDKIVDIPLGVDLIHYSPMEKNTGLLPVDLQVAEDDFLIISVVNLIPVKGIENLIQGVIEMKDPRVQLWIVGYDEGEYARKLKSMSERFASIRFLGKKKDVRPYLACADLFVIPTLETGEGLPLAPLEAIASGRIVVGSNVSGIKDILSPFPDLLFPPDDVDRLKHCILQIMNMDSHERKQLEGDLRAHIIDNYSLQRSVQLNSELYIDLLE